MCVCVATSRVQRAFSCCSDWSRAFCEHVGAVAEIVGRLVNRVPSALLNMKQNDEDAKGRMKQKRT